MTTQEFTAARVASPVYANATLQDTLRNDDRVAPQLEGGGIFVDDGWDRWAYLVTPGQAGPNVLTLQQLVLAPPLTWWKKIEISTSFFGTWFGSARLASRTTTGPRPLISQQPTPKAEP